MLLFPFVMLCACDHAGPGFRGLDKVERQVEGSRFTLRRNGAIVEAIRMNSEWLPRFPDVARKAALAAEDVTGCDAAWVQGDPAMVWVGLSCDGAIPPAIPKRHKVLQCDSTDFYSRGGLASGSLSCVKG